MKSATGKTSLGLQGCLETCRRCEQLAQVIEEADGRGVSVSCDLGIAFPPSIHPNRRRSWLSDV